jgi:nucleotide-binding universal stress UspA family protein
LIQVKVPCRRAADDGATSLEAVMTIKSILVPMTGTPRDRQALALAWAVAKPAAAHIRVCITLADPREVISAMGLGADAFSVERIIRDAEQEAQQTTKRAREAFDGWRTQNDLAITDAPGQTERATTEWCELMGRPEDVVARAGGAVDLIVFPALGDDKSPLDQATVEAALFGSGRPVLIAPATLPSDPTDTAVVAWNGSPEANRAVAAALPLLTTCRRVLVFCEAEANRAPGHPDVLIGYLARHGIKAVMLPAAIGHGDLGARLLDTAAQAKASLLVMGAYTHGRLRQMVFGGVTSHVIATTGIPALLAH